MLEVFPESILIKNGDTHHFSNEAIARKFKSSNEEFKESFKVILQSAPARQIKEDQQVDTCEPEDSENKTLGYFVSEGEQALR